MFQYCPACGSRGIGFSGNRFHCPACGFVYYHNTAAATGCVIRSGEGLLLLVRGKEPALGKLDLPGGFVNPGEGALEGLLRELEEEIGWTPPRPPGRPLTELFTLFASFPNVYPYRKVVYNTCDLFFSLSAPELREADLRLEASEIAAVRFVPPGEINLEDLAFDSTRRALRAWLAGDWGGIKKEE
jgi:ADP-ribose pyrophosphatase YjhB (NUDIX family)